MISPFKLSWPVGHSDSMDKDDVDKTRRALRSLGLYRDPKLFVARFSNEPMVQGLKAFQRQQGLVPDGVMKPDGPTHRRLNEVIGEQQLVRAVTGPSRRRSREPNLQPTLSIPKSGEDNGLESMDGLPGEADQTALVHIPVIVYEIALLMGMSVAAAWAWWKNLPKEEKEKVRARISQIGSSDDDDSEDDTGFDDPTDRDIAREAFCEYLYEYVDLPTCRALGRAGKGKEASICYGKAEERRYLCRAGIPPDKLPPLFPVSK